MAQCAGAGAGEGTQTGEGLRAGAEKKNTIIEQRVIFGYGPNVALGAKPPC